MSWHQKCRGPRVLKTSERGGYAKHFRLHHHHQKTLYYFSINWFESSKKKVEIPITITNPRSYQPFILFPHKLESIKRLNACVEKIS